MLTSTQFALGVHVLTLLARSAPEPLSSEALACSARANPVSVRRVLGQLREAGFVASRPGHGGGSHLVRDPSAITLADIWLTLYGESPLLASYQGQPDCAVGSKIESMVAEIDCGARQAILNKLQATTIGQLVCRAASETAPVRYQTPT